MQYDEHSVNAYGFPSNGLLLCVLMSLPNETTECDDREHVLHLDAMVVIRVL